MRGIHDSHARCLRKDRWWLLLQGWWKVSWIVIHLAISRSEPVQCPGSAQCVLDRHSVSWDLSKPILVDKLFPREPEYTTLMELSYSVGVPPTMEARGIKQLHQAHVAYLGKTQQKSKAGGKNYRH